MSQEIIEASLERVADQLGDISDPVYARFYAASPAAEGLMSHLDPLARGKMMEEILRLLMTEDMSGESEYLDFETKTHREAYFVAETMYEPLMAAVLDTIREGDPEWDDAVANAWQTRVGAVLEGFTSRFA